MSKKRSTPKSRRVAPKVKRIHYFYVLVPAVAIAVIVTYALLPIKNSGVLSVHTRLARNSHEGNLEITAEGGDVKMKGPNRNHETKIHIEAEDGDEIEIDDDSGASGSGHGKGRMRNIREQALRRAEQLERKAERKENKELKENLTVISEDGEEVKVKRNRREKLLVLPEAAVAALLKNGHLQAVASGSANASGSGVVVYTRSNGKPVYIIAGLKEEKLFGAFPVNLDKTVTVSAETGEVVTTEESFVTKILDLFSF